MEFVDRAEGSIGESVREADGEFFKGRSGGGRSVRNVGKESPEEQW